MFETKVVERIKTRVLLLFFFSENHAMYKIMCKNIVGVGQATDDNMTHAHSMLDTYATNTYSDYVVLTAFPLLQLLHARA
jgi:hypothetical protein